MSPGHHIKCFFSLVKKAFAIKKLFRLYVREKKISKSEAGNENKCLCAKITEPSDLPGSKKPNAGSKKNGYFENFLVEDTIQNFVLKSVLGFLGGILLTYICFMFLVFSLNFTLKRATYICMGLGIILSLGLAFSVKIRCTVFLCIPQLFSKRGRQALLAYAFILALSGPAKNTLHNVEVMSESLACGQEQIKQAENELLKCVQRPNAAAKKSVEKLLIKLNSAVQYFKNFVLQFYRTCFDVLETLFHAQKWLYSISLLCNKEMGDPTERCQNLLIDSSENCQATADFLYWKKLCQFNPFAVQWICSTYEDEFCYLKDVHRCPPIGDLQRQLDTFKRRAMNILYVRVDVHQTFTQSNRSNTFHEEYQGMATEIRQKTDQFLQYFDFMSVIFGIFILVLFVKVIIYRHKFLTEDHYDNRFITPDFEDIDNTRAEFKMETILPLKPREKTKYIKVTSIRLVPCEKIRLLSSFVFLIFATFKIIIHMLTDSSLYWILSSVRRDERLLYMNSLKEEEPGIIVRINGNGMVAALFRNVSDAVERQYSTPKLDPTPCLPDPVSPDWNRYYQILALVLICWLLALFEPYGLRLRHTVMVTYHPDRARERAIWLYNRIISHRNSYVKIARREIRRKYKNAPEEPVFGGNGSMKCLLCKVKVTKGDNHIKCTTEHCVGLFCFDCYSSLKYCSICTDPAQYGDLSDLSEEKDSSEEETACKYAKDGDSGDREKSQMNAVGLMNIKKPKFKKSLEGSPAQSGKLLRPGLLHKALIYCRNTVSTWEGSMILAEGESDFQNSAKGGTDGSIRKTKSEKDGGLVEVISESDEEKKCECFKLIQKSSPTEFKSFPSPGTDKWNHRGNRASNERPKPDFWFKNIKPAVTNETKPGFLTAKDSFETLRRCELKKKTSRSEEDLTSNSSFSSDDNKETSANRVRFIVKKYSCEFASSSKSEDVGLEIRRTKGLREKEWKKEGLSSLRGSIGETRRIRQGRARVCTKHGSSSDSPTDSFRLCSTRKNASSSESHCESRVCPSANSRPGSKGGNTLKRISGGVRINRTDLSSTSTDSDPGKHKYSGLCKKARSCGRNPEGVGCSKDRCSADECKRSVEGGKEARKKSSRLSWAPDLLSDLPLPKQEGSGTSTDKD